MPLVQQDRSLDRLTINPARYRCATDDRNCDDDGGGSGGGSAQLW